MIGMGNAHKVCVILGTRPEIIKMSPILRLLRERGADHFTLHTGERLPRGIDAAPFEPPRFDPRRGRGLFRSNPGRDRQKKCYIFVSKV